MVILKNEAFIIHKEAIVLCSVLLHIPGEKSGACARAVSFEGTGQPDDQSDLGLTPSQFPRQLPALGCADLRSFYHPTWATLHHCAPLRHWHWPAFASCGFTPSLHLGDTLGRTTPACLISSQREEELLGGRKRGKARHRNKVSSVSTFTLGAPRLDL